MMKPLVEITDWSIVPRANGDFDVLMGIPLNHPNHVPGQMVSNTTVIVTSPIQSINYEQQIIETENTRYHLSGPRLASTYATETSRVQDSKS